ncbi:hypothetical protein [Terricaulis sp.]|uniref:hypothetical protein n=1 Tax=Terricaulis sp. TaxID=2768686 RepID=UPI003784D849
MSNIATTERQIVGAERVVERNALAESFIDRSGSYFDLKPDVDVTSVADGYHVGIDLFQGKHSRVDELGAAAETFFTFRPRFFRYVVPHKQRVRDLIRNPFSHADLEEEEIEEKFPDDIRRRALLKALNFVLVRNQLRHIYRKRTYQAAYSVALIAIAIVWLVLGEGALRMAWSTLPASAIRDALLSPAAVLAAWAASFILVMLASFPLLRFFYRRDLLNTTDRFKSSNETACAKASESMTNFSKEVGERFSNLINAIRGSEDHLELVREEHWPAHAREIFRIALWDAKRVECLEKFWQLQFERLRIYELILDRLGNLTSVLLAWVLVFTVASVLAVVALLTRDVAHLAMSGGVLVAALWIIRRFGRISRDEKMSFDMNDIIDQGLETRWPPFSKIDYYDRIAQEIENGLGAKRIIKIQNIFQGPHR